jgi:hypothetical protein
METQTYCEGGGGGDRRAGSGAGRNGCQRLARVDGGDGGSLPNGPQVASLRPCCYGGLSGWVFGTLRYPHLILPYLAYYDHLASHYGGPWCSPIPWWCDQKHLHVPYPPIYKKMVGLLVLSVLTMGSPHTKVPPYDF